MKKLSVSLAITAVSIFIATACGSTSSEENSRPDASQTIDATVSDSDSGSGRPDASRARDAARGSDAVEAADLTDARYYPPDDVVSSPGFLACNQTPPQGAIEAAPFPVYAGTCPTLVATAPAIDGGPPVSNTIMSSGNARQFLLAVPSDLKPTEQLPIVFMWHWLHGSDVDFYNVGDIQQAVNSQRFLAVIPEDKGDIEWDWPFAISDSTARLDEEFQFFDDMLACVAAQFPTVNRNCVASGGISAGALFTDQLGAARADHLSSILSLSGGVGGLVRPWGNPTHVLPVLVLWGGPTDWCGLDFQTESKNLEASLGMDGNFVVECIHNCGHSAPPMTPPPGESTYASLWSFVFDHPYWLAAGESPYLSTGLPSDYPSWCAIGIGKATMRTGACTNETCIDDILPM
jgi:hypothetical protein